MGAKRIEYQIVGRYMNGKEVTAYHLQSLSTGKNGKYTREQIAYLVGRGQITNCEAQIYQDKLLFRGKGMNIDDLPVQKENGELTRTSGLGKVKKGTAAGDAMTQMIIVKTIVSGRNTMGYVVQNAGGGVKNYSREDVMRLAQSGKIGNARVQNYKGKWLLRGVGCNLNELPVENIGTPKKQPTAPSAPSASEAEINEIARVADNIISYMDSHFIGLDNRMTKVHDKADAKGGKSRAVKWQSNIANFSIVADYNGQFWAAFSMNNSQFEINEQKKFIIPNDVKNKNIQPYLDSVLNRIRIADRITV